MERVSHGEDEEVAFEAVLEGAQGAISAEGGEHQAEARAHEETGRHQAVQVVEPTGFQARLQPHVHRVDFHHDQHDDTPQLIHPIAAAGRGKVFPKGLAHMDSRNDPA